MCDGAKAIPVGKRHLAESAVNTSDDAVENMGAGWYVGQTIMMSAQVCVVKIKPLRVGSDLSAD